MRETPIVLLLAVSLLGLCQAQEARGTIFGTILDQQGGRVPGADVGVLNVGTNAVKQTVSNDRGYYEVPLLDPGSYSVTVELAGFRKFVREGIVLNVSGRAEINITLQLGELSQVVQVVEQAPLLETSTASAGRVVDNRQIMQLPYSDLNPYVLAGMAAGMQWTGAPDANRTLWSGGGTSAFNTAGGVGQNEYTIDGAPNTGSSRRVAFIAPTDAVGEFKLETANFDASFGHTSGATVNLSTKSGNNQFHGTLYNTHWQQRWNGTPHFTRLQWEDRVAKGLITKDTPKQQPGRSNSPGATIGGPVIIPKIFNGRDKLFFFFNYSGIYQNLTDQPDRLNVNVPKEAWRKGDFSDLLAIDPVLYQIYDPRTARLEGNRVVRDPFPGNKGIPVLNPMYKLYEKIYPLPNNPAGLVTAEGFNNYFAAGMPKIDRHHSLLNRIDWEVSQNHKIFGRWYWNNRKADTSDWTYQSDPGLHSSGTSRINKAVGVDWVWTLSNATVLNLTGAYNRFTEFAGEQGPKRYKPSDAGLPAYLDERAGDNKILPVLDFSSLEDVSYPVPAVTRVSSGTVKTQFFHYRGNHSFKAGVDVRKYYRAQVDPGYASSAFTFRNTFTQATSDTTTASNHGLEWAAFMMGYPTSIYIDTNDSFYMSTPYAAFYAHDNFRIGSKLTLGLGLRFEYEGGSTERFNRGLAGGFFPDEKLPFSDLVQAAYAAKPIPELAASDFHVAGGVRYLGENAPANFGNGSKNLMPRLGLAYRLTPQTVLRAGYGLFYDTNNVSNFALNQWGFSQRTTSQPSLDNGLTFVASPLDPFPLRSSGTRFDEPLRNALGSVASAGQSWDFTDQDWEAQFQQRWRFGVQRQLSKDMVVEVAYTGSYAQTNATRRLDALPQQFWATGMVRNADIEKQMTTNVPNPYNYKNLGALQTSNLILYNFLRTQGRFTSSNIRKHELLRPYSYMTRLRDTSVPDGRVRYNALEIQLEKRFAAGLMFNVLYTFTDSETRDWYANEFDLLPSWHPNSLTVPHRFVLTSIYELPFGPGRAWLNHGVLGQIIGGWQLSGVYQNQSGPPITWGNEFYYGDISELEEAFEGSRDKDIHQWFDPNVPFEKSSSKRPGTYHVRVFPDRINSLRADGIENLDVRILRSFSLVGEDRLKMNLSLDMLNAFNHTNYGAPTVSPTSSNFGKVTSQRGLPRLINLTLRFVF